MFQGKGGDAAALAALEDAEKMLLRHGPKTGDPVIGYRWYRLCTGYAQLGDEEAACRSFGAAVNSGLHKVKEYNADYGLRPSAHPAIEAMSAGGTSALGMFIERYERTQQEGEDEMRLGYLRRRAKTSKEMTPSDLMAEGVSVNRAADAADQVRAMHMRRSGGLRGMVDPDQLPELEAQAVTEGLAAVLDSVAPGRHRQQPGGRIPDAAGAARGGRPVAVAESPARAPVDRPAMEPMPELPSISESSPAQRRGLQALGSLSTSSDLLYLKQSGDQSIQKERPQLASDPLEWSIDEVGRWLESLSLAMHCQTFAQHLIDGETLLSLTPDDISESLGVRKLGHCKVLAKGILALRKEAIGTTVREEEEG